MIPWFSEHILTILIASPLVGIVLLCLVPKKYGDASSEVAVFSTGLTLFIALLMFGLFEPEGRFAFSENYVWLPYLGASFHVAADGLSIIAALSVSLVTFIEVLIFWKRIKREAGKVFLTLLVFEMAFIGYFLAADLLLLYIFMEIGVISLGMLAMFLKRGEGHYISRYIGFMSLSSLLFLTIVAFLMVSAFSTDMLAVENIDINAEVQIWLFLGLMITVFIRGGLFPFHVWIEELGDGIKEFILALVSILFVASAYLLYRLLPTFAVASALSRPYVTWLVVSSIIASALISLTRRDLVSLFTYVAMAEFGFVFLGLFSMSGQGLAGAGMQMITLLISFSMLTVIFAMLKRRGIDIFDRDLKGVFASTPVFGLSFLVVVFALAATPGLSQFPGLYMIWMGLFREGWVLTLASLLGMVIMASALVYAATLALFKGGEVQDNRRGFSAAELFSTVPFLVLMFAIGISPDILLKYIKLSTEAAWAVISQQI